MAREVDYGGERAFALDDGAGATALVVPGIGANCVSLAVPVEGKTARLLSSPPSAEALRQRPTWWGFPILAPYPGRHRTPFIWHNRSYAILANDRPGVALHGFAAGAAWEVVEATAGSVACRLDSEQIERRAERWPWPLQLTATYRLERGRLTLEVEVENRADEEVPHLLGLHPYIPIRLAGDVNAGETAEAARARETCQVWVAADELWELSGGLGTGEIRRLENGWDLRRPKSIAELERTLGQPPEGIMAAGSVPRLPVLLYGKRAALRSYAASTDPAEDGGVYSGVRDLASGIELTLAASAAFGSLALYCPPGQPHIALEPRSAVSNALELMHDPRRLSTGIWPLAPGGTWKAWARIEVRALRHTVVGARVS